MKNKILLPDIHTFHGPSSVQIWFVMCMCSEWAHGWPQIAHHSYTNYHPMIECANPFVAPKKPDSENIEMLCMYILNVRYYWNKQSIL